jgi:hypothetical protein
MKISSVNVAGHYAPNVRDNEAILMEIFVIGGMKISVYVDLVDMDVTLHTTADGSVDNTKIIPLHK